ncbi:sugar phosphate isomerase/epimerase family protein [Mariniluteicoccus flavus]
MNEQPDDPTPVSLSTSAAYPESTAAGFAYAERLGYDGVEVMVGLDAQSLDVDALERLRDHHGLPVVSIHAPTLLVLQRVWGSDPWEKLERSAEAANRLGASTVVVHPPFRWQGRYASAFAEGVRRLTETTGVEFCVENMYPWRTPRGEFKAYLPGWDPTELDYDHLTLDLSHASTARQDSLALARSWGDRLRHLHVTDGKGSFKDEHLVPGRGDQPAAELLEYLAGKGWDGHVVLEVNTRGSGGRAGREADLVEALEFTRTHLARGRTPDHR